MTSQSAAIFHGTNCSAESFWIPWIKAKLESRGYDVWTPSLPKNEDGFAHLNQWQEVIRKESPYQDYDLMIGHSAGVPLIFSLLSQGTLKTAHALLVAGFLNPIPEMTEDHPTHPGALDYEAIKKNGGRFTYLHSDNDPWTCDHNQGEAMRQAFGGTLVVQTGEGHFGSELFGQPYPTFPLLLAHCFL